jgi:Skp family chaperone for outer membrane proteins
VRIISNSIIALILGSLIGCTQQPDTGSTLVLDPVAIAKSLGRDELMQEKMNAALVQLNEQLQQHSNLLTMEVKRKRSNLSKDDGEEDPEKLRQLLQLARNNSLQAEQLARTKADEYRKGLLEAFNQELHAVAMDIARERGATSVVTQAGNLLWHDPSIDITGEVIARLRASESLRPASSGRTSDSIDADQLLQLESTLDALEQERKE